MSFLEPDMYDPKAIEAAIAAHLPCLHVQVEGEDGVHFTGLVVSEAFRGKRLRLSAFLKAEDVGGAATLWLRVDAERGRVVAFDNMEARQSVGALSGTTDWLKRSIVLDVPAEAVTVNFGSRATWRVGPTRRSSVGR